MPKLRLAIPRLATIAIFLALCAADPARDAAPREGAGAVLEARVRKALERLHWSPESVDLRQGVPVHEGQKVQVGDLLGYSGSTGFSEVPHLHFQVSIRRKEGESRSIPVRFRNGTPGGYLPAAWRLYENRTRPRASLRVSLQDRQLSSGQAFEIAGREPLQLRVERVGGPGEALDVTRDPRTSYVALTPWSLRVDRGGRVEFEPSSDQWKALPEAIRRNTAIVTILFRDDDGKEGYFDAWFRFAGAPGAGLEKP